MADSRPLCRRWMFEAIRHVHKNMEIGCELEMDGNEWDEHDRAFRHPQRHEGGEIASYADLGYAIAEGLVRFKVRVELVADGVVDELLEEHIARYNEMFERMDD